MLLRSPLPLDENANLGTVMRYEEIGEWGGKSGALGAACPHHGQNGGGERLENPGWCLLPGLLSGESQAKFKVSVTPGYTA